MGSFVLYKKLSNKTILKSAKEAIIGIEKFFKTNPKRKICTTQLWYGKIVKIRKGKVIEGINTAAKLAIENK